MSGEECIMNVGHVSASESDDEWIDVEADENLGMSGMDSDFLDEEEGAKGRSRKGHHNKRQIKRKKRLKDSYARLTRLVKRINPRLAKTKMGRSKTLKIAVSQLKTGLEQIEINKAEARSLIEKLKKERSETDNEEKKELDKDISELETYVNQKIVIENYPEDKELPWGGQEEEEDQKEEVEEEEEPEGSDEDEDSWVSDDDPDHSSSQSCVATVDNDDTTSHVSP